MHEQNQPKTIDAGNSLKQNLTNTPLPEELQVDQSVTPQLQAQIAIQPVVEALKS